MFFGKILRDTTSQTKPRTIKQMGLKKNANLVVQILDSPEELSENSQVLLFCKRDVANRDYSLKKESVFSL